MAGTSAVYNEAKGALMDGTLDLDAAVIHNCLIQILSTVDDPDNDKMSSLSLGTNEMSQAGYVAGHGNAGRKILDQGSAVSVDDANNRAEWVASNSSTPPPYEVVWTSLGGTQTVRGDVIHVKGSTDDTDALLIVYVALSDTVTNGGDFTIQFDVDGILQLT
jgi:hypothetical protein